MFDKNLQGSHLGLKFFMAYFKITNPISFISIHIFLFLLETILVVCGSLEIFLFYPDYLICCHTIVHSIPYDLFYFCKVGDHISSFVPDFSNLNPLFFFFIKPSQSSINFVDLFKE